MGKEKVCTTNVTTNRKNIKKPIINMSYSYYVMIINKAENAW